jgi:hypothetical protein
MPRVRDLLVVVLRLHAGDSDRADTFALVDDRFVHRLHEARAQRNVIILN